MTSILHYAVLVGALCSLQTEIFAQQPKTDSTLGVTIPVSANSYLGPDGMAKIYFLAAHPGMLQIRLRLKSSHHRLVSVRLDADTKDTSIRIYPSKSWLDIPAGSFEIATIGYHYLSIKLKNSNQSLYDIRDIIMSGPAAEGLLYNNSQYKGAASTHLTYTVPGDSAVSWFYSEISVPKTADHSSNAYYETNGFLGGYLGIQLNSKKERRIIFSVWSNYRTDDPKQIPSDFQVRLIKKGTGVLTGEFGNEGSGGHSHLVYLWKPDVVYKLLVGARAAGDHTIYTAWYYAPENHEWRLIAQWNKTKTGGRLLSGLYSFVENFGNNGQDLFTARYGNQWVCTPSGNWIELTEARFSTTADPLKHPRFDYGGGLTTVTNADGKTQDWFYMFSGGFRQTNNLPPKSHISRPASGVPPTIDLEALPDK